MFFTKAYKNISPKAGKEMMEQDKNVLLLDVRTREEHKAGHIPGSTLIPLDSLEHTAETKLGDKDRPVIVYCLSGGRSAVACKILAGKGYTNILNMGGIMNWPYERVSK
ncbi:rhodanese-like domain-containing protein [Anaerotalea alkaliphila]|uniref:Rhodanese-like domain-containing protein n=1 Tax=Anaerotalea alkaliphila TaxID=2662126 RepID=A0A7X5HTB4_9FIRM|nr:rhodanese-like domain-containing protein [Anaerotalea alkaliphila]NDL66290.1 rhodanese-like domain-containing protein [Anaerotalea alkaliphila]